MAGEFSSTRTLSIYVWETRKEKEKSQKWVSAKISFVILALTGNHMKNLTLQTMSFLTELERTMWNKNKLRIDSIWHWIQCRTWGKNQWYSSLQHYICFFLLFLFFLLHIACSLQQWFSSFTWGLVKRTTGPHSQVLIQRVWWSSRIHISINTSSQAMLLLLA